MPRFPRGTASGLRVIPWLLLALTLQPAGRAHAGAWVPDPGSGYVKLWSKWLHGSGYHDGAGNTITYGGYDELFVATYAEYGVLPALALTWHMDLVRAAWLAEPPSSARRGHVTAGDPRLGARVALLQEGRFALAAELTALAPLADHAALQPFVYADGTSAGALRLGAGVWELGASLSAGVGFDGAYTQASAGYLLRTDGFDHVVQFQLEGGADVTDALALRLRISGHLSIEARDAPYLDNPAGIGNGVSYVGFALEADYELAPGFFLGLTGEGGLLAIERQTGGPVVSLYGAHAF